MEESEFVEHWRWKEKIFLILEQYLVGKTKEWMD